MKPIKYNSKTIFLGITLSLIGVGTSRMAHGQNYLNPNLEEIVRSGQESGYSQNFPTPSLEELDGPTAKINMAEVEEIKQYAIKADSEINYLLSSVSQLTDSVEIKNKLFNGTMKIIENVKDSRSVLLLTHCLKAGITLIRLIEQQSINRGITFTPQGTVDQEVRILKRTLKFASTYFESDFEFRNGVMEKNEIKTNPKFVQFGTELNAFIIKMSDGLLNASASYGMIRWSLAILADYMIKDKMIGDAYAATTTHLANTLLGKDDLGRPNFPDLVNGGIAPADVECLRMIRELKSLYKTSLEDMKNVKIGK